MNAGQLLSGRPPMFELVIDGHRIPLHEVTAEAADDAARSATRSGTGCVVAERFGRSSTGKWRIGVHAGDSLLSYARFAAASS